MSVISGLKNLVSGFSGNKALLLIVNAGNIVWQSVTFVLDNLLQRVAMPDGLDVYEADGQYYLPDNVEGSQLRTIQEGRGYKFTGVEHSITDELGVLSFTDFECSIIANITLGQSNNGLFSITPTGLTQAQGFLQATVSLVTNQLNFRKGAEYVVSVDITNYCGSIHEYKFTISGTTWAILIDDIEVGSSTNTIVPSWLNTGKFLLGGYYNTLYLIDAVIYSCVLNTEAGNVLTYNLDESAGLTAYDASGNDNHGDIDLGGSAESAFHITSSDVSSVQNEVGYNIEYVRRAGDNILQSDFLNNALPTGGSLSGDSIILTGSTVNIQPDNAKFGGYWFEYELHPTSYNYANFNQTPSWGLRISDGVWVAMGSSNHSDVNLYSKFRCRHYSTGNVQIVYLRAFAGTCVWLDSYSDIIPINEAIPTQDVLGNTPPANYLGQVRYETLIKDGSVGNFDSILYSTVSNNSAYELQEFEVDCIFKHEIGSSGMFAISHYHNTGESNGITMHLLSDTQFYIQYSNGLTTIAAILFTLGISLYGKKVRYTIKKYDGNVYLTVNDGVNEESQSKAFAATIFYDNSVRETLIGARYSTGFLAKAEGQCYSLSFYELNVSGNRVNELINLQFSETNGAIVYNVAADRPANSNMAWVLGGSIDGTQWGVDNSQYPKNLIEGYWRANPDDDIKYPYNVGGDKIQVVGDGKLIVNAENVFDRNYGDAPNLVAAGVPQTEDISYEDITDDISRFYDKSIENTIQNLVVYSDDYLAEPIAGSVGNFDDNLWGSIPHNAAYNAQYLDIEVLCILDNYSSDLGRIYSNGAINVFTLYYSSNTLRLKTNSGIQSVSTAGYVTNGRLHKIRARSGNGGKQIWVDDVEVSYSSLGGSDANGTDGNPKKIGAFSTGSQFMDGKIFYLKLWSVDANGNRLLELMNFNFSEETGLSWYNIATDRPANSDASVILNGSSNGTQWLLAQNKDYHHNLKYGYYNDAGAKVPGDPNNIGFDVNGNPITNATEVNKYNEISDSLNR